MERDKDNKAKLIYIPWRVRNNNKYSLENYPYKILGQAQVR
jgi:hypothetical protein